MLKSSMRYLILMLGLMLLGGCVGSRTFHEVARAGDTVAVATGWKQKFLRETVTVTITPSSGNPIVYGPNNPAVRAIVNLYPDPVSSIVVSKESGQDLTPYAQFYADLITGNLTNGEKDWWQTTVFIDLPSTLPTGTASIEISNPSGAYAYSSVDIVGGTGTPNTFYTTAGPLSVNQLASLERVPHYTVNFTGNTIPYAIQVNLSHNPDVDHGGSGRAYVINPRGDMKNATWANTGTSIRVIIMPARGQALGSMKDYKIYIAGGVTNLSVQGIKAVDINGNPVAGVSAGIGTD
jgi:hypothetical protein